MIKRIRAIAKAIRGKKQPKAMVSLQDVQRLRVLLSTPEWKTYQRLLELYVEQYAEAMLSTESNARLHYLRGYVTALRQSTLYAEQIAAQEHNARTDRSADATDRRSAALYATSAWQRFGAE